MRMLGEAIKLDRSWAEPRVKDLLSLIVRWRQKAASKWSVVTEREKQYFKKGVGYQCAVRKVKQVEDSLCAIEVIGG